MAVVLVRRAPEWLGTAAQPLAPSLPVVFVRPLPIRLPPPPRPPEPAEPTATPGESTTAAPAGERGEPPRRRPPDLVFVLEEPAHADDPTPRVAGTAGVSVPEIAPESTAEAERIGRLPRQGWVVLRVLVLRDGTVGDVAVEPQGDAVAAPSIAAAVRGLRFRPAREGGRAVDAWYTMAWPPL